MEEQNDLKNVTPEQKKEISKAFNKSQLSLLWIGGKLAVCLFTANLICLTLGKILFVDSDPTFMLGFQAICVFTNIFLVTRHFVGQLNAVGDILKDRIKQILKK